MASAEEVEGAIAEYRRIAAYAGDFVRGYTKPEVLDALLEAGKAVADSAEAFLADPPQCACGDYHWTCDDGQDDDPDDRRRQEAAEAIADAQGMTFQGGGVIRAGVPYAASALDRLAPGLTCSAMGRHAYVGVEDQKVGSTVTCPRCGVARTRVDAATCTYTMPS